MKKKMRIRLFAILLSAVLLLPHMAFSVFAEGEDLPDLKSDSAVLMDADSGYILYAKEADAQYPPAALAKIMTVLIALQQDDLQQEITMTETGVAEVNEESSNLYSEVGEVFTLEQMIYAAMLKSANDLTMQMGEFLGGGNLPK